MEKRCVSKAFFFQARHDFKQGIFCRWPQYLPAVLLFLIECLSLQAAIAAEQRVTSGYPGASMADYFLFLFRGVEKYVPTPESIFNIPILWLAPHLYLGYLVGYYPLRDLSGFGQQILLRAQNRSAWWLSKCLWNGLSVAAFYLIGALTIFTFMICMGNFHFTPTAEIILNQCSISASPLSARAVFIAAVILPLLSSLALSLLQMLLAFLLKPIFGYLIISCFLLFSVCIESPFFLGNGLMAIRSELITSGGLSFIDTALFSVVVVVFSIVAGNCYLKRYDILH